MAKALKVVNKKNEAESEIIPSVKAPTYSFKKPFGGKNPGNKTGRLDARKLTTKVRSLQFTFS